jgi:hypothetical protein
MTNTTLFNLPDTFFLLNLAYNSMKKHSVTLNLAKFYSKFDLVRKKLVAWYVFFNKKHSL